MTPRTCAFPPCETPMPPGGQGWSTGHKTLWTLDPTESESGTGASYDLCPEHRGYEPPPVDMETYPIWDPSWGPVPNWVIAARETVDPDASEGA